MQIQVRNDKVIIDGYVNAIERDSKPLLSRIGRFIERICKGAFGKALKRNDDVHVLLNHDWDRDLGSTKQGNLTLEEDAIGLKAHFETDDAEVVKDAQNGDLVGWSFGFQDREVEMGSVDDMPLRLVKDLDLFEVSILDRTKTPAYDGTLVSVRADESAMYHGEPLMEEMTIIEERAEESDQTEQETVESVEIKQIDYSKWENLINDMREV